MKVKIKAVHTDGYTPVEIHTDFIKLDAFLKFSMTTETGGDAKLMIQDGEVSVNGEICTQRGRKLHPGDKVDAAGVRLRVIRKAEHAD